MKNKLIEFKNVTKTYIVGENVALVKDVTNTTKKVKKVLNSVGLERHMNKFPSELSGGEQQRVSIARTVMKNPKLLLCDEPTGTLDSKTGVEILKLLNSECDNDTTVIIVTHNQLIKAIHIKNGEVDKVIINKSKKNIDEVSW